MAIKIDCPRCKTLLQVPNKLADGYVNCPNCRGRVWVSKNASADATPTETVSAVTNVVEPVAALPPNLRPPTTPSIPIGEPPTPANVSPSVKWTPPPVPVVPLSPSVPQKRIARFITAPPADSTLRLAPDGKLPELHLEEGATKEKQEAKTTSVNPLVMFGALSMSVVLSIMLVLIDWEPQPATRAGQKAVMRQRIEDEYFGAGSLSSKNLESYQMLLREAQLAHTRGDYKIERQQYRKVLDMLRAERGSEDRGLTGSRSKDKRLEEAISVLLSGG